MIKELIDEIKVYDELFLMTKLFRYADGCQIAESDDGSEQIGS